MLPDPELKRAVTEITILETIRQDLTDARWFQSTARNFLLTERKWKRV